MLRRGGMEVISEIIQYKQTVDGMAKHIVYGNIIFTIIEKSENKFYSLLYDL